MARQIFVNHSAACMVLDDTIHVMLLTHAKFREFTPKAIADSKKSTEVLLAVSCDSREEVDDLVRRAVAAGRRSPGMAAGTLARLACGLSRGSG